MVELADEQVVAVTNWRRDAESGADLPRFLPIDVTGCRVERDKRPGMPDDQLPGAAGFDPELSGDSWIARFRDIYPNEFEDAETTEADDGFERIPLPGFIKKRIMKSLAHEAHTYLFNVNGIRTEIRTRVLDDMGKVPQSTRHVLVGHSQGSFIAYDVLTGTNCKEISGFMTLGSPLWVDEIQDELVWTRDNGFPTKVRGGWVNVYDALDVVARPDPQLANDFRLNGQEQVVDVNEQNWGRWRHSATKYFKGPKLRHHLRALCGREDA